MASDLAGKVALVTGASSGINLAIARRLGEYGARLAILSRTPDRIEAAAAGLRAEGYDAAALAGDVRDAAHIADLMDDLAARTGPIDIVVSGAAGNFFVNAEAMSPNAFKTVIDIDLIGTFNVIKAAFPHLRKPGGSIVNVSAPQAQRAMPRQAHACAAKAGIDMLTRCLALEWGVHGIRVNAVSPGPIDRTEGLARMAAGDGLMNAIVNDMPMKRLGQGEEIGEAVAFLCSEAASFVTGTVIDCDGGMKLGNFHVAEASP